MSSISPILLVLPVLLVLATVLAKCIRVEADGGECQDDDIGGFAFSGLVLTMVHGTWGRGMFYPKGDAAWTTDASILCSLLRKRFGQKVVFQRFKWSGANTHTARMRAAKKLRAYLKDSVERWPNAMHFVIAHSHGGNVALYAMDDISLHDKIVGLACLATPFISVRERELGRNRADLFNMSIAVLLFGILFWVGASIHVEGRIKTAIIVACVIILSLGVIGLFPPFLMQNALARAQKLSNDLSPSLPKAGQLLIIRSPADEASGLIGIFQFFSQVTMRLFFVVETVQARIDRLVKRWAQVGAKFWKINLAVATAASFLLLASAYEDAQQQTQPVVAWIMIIIAMISFFSLAASFFALVWALILKLPGGPEFMARNSMIIIAELVWYVIILLSLLMVLPFGWQAALANFFLDVTVDSTPVGTWEVHLINPPTGRHLDASAPPMMHAVHGNPEAISLLGDWIENRSASWRVLIPESGCVDT